MLSRPNNRAADRQVLDHKTGMQVGGWNSIWNRKTRCRRHVAGIFCLSKAVSCPAMHRLPWVFPLVSSSDSDFSLPSRIGLLISLFQAAGAERQRSLAAAHR